MSKKNVNNRQVSLSENIFDRYQYISSDDKFIVFSFRYFQKGYDISNCKQNEFKSLENFLKSRSCLQWCFIKQAPREGFGFETLDYLNVNKPDEIKHETIISFRASDIMRIIGFRRNEIFYIVWIDPKGKVYKH